MAELRLVGVSEDGQHLVLADDAGHQHTIMLDERLRAAVNGQLSRLAKLTMALESRISPREIQERVRGGESAEHVAVTAGVPLERVLRFVGPVLREREHVVDQARRARLAGASGPTSLLADLVARAADRLGADVDEVSWDSARREDHSWVVTVAWPDGTAAAWGLDLARHQATPLDAAARRISGLADDGAVLARRTIDLDAESLLGAESLLDGKALLDREERDLDPDETEYNVRLFVPRGAAAPGEDGDFRETAPVHKVDLAEGTDPSGAADPAGIAEPATATEPASGGSPERATPPPRAGRSPRRARVPKWDDIMFGPKSKE